MKKTIYILAVLFIAIVFSGCRKVDTAQVRSYADDIAENILSASSSMDYEKYINFFDPSFRYTLTEAKVASALSMIESRIGTYQPNSRVFYKAIAQSKDGKKYTTLLYKARFTGESEDVLVTIILSDEDHKVQTFLLNSPKLIK
jgi:hypothetical protein